jgi:hypothetical protein
MAKPFSNVCQKEGHEKGPGECAVCRRKRQLDYAQSDKGLKAAREAQKRYHAKKKQAVSYTDYSPLGDSNGCHEERALPQNVIQSAGQAS